MAEEVLRVDFYRLFPRPHLPRGLRGLMGELDNIVGQSRIIETPEGKRVVKDYGRVVGIVKWLLGLLPPASVHYPYETSPLGRLVREERFYQNPPRGIRVPRVYEVDYRHAVMIKEYLEGRLLSEPTQRNAGLVGEVLGKVHSQGYCLGDTKPSNFLETPRGELAIIDAEQALVGCDEEEFMDWDVLLALVFLYYEDPLIPVASYEDMVGSFVERYARYRRLGPDSIKRASVLLLLMPPQYSAVVKKALV